MIGLYYLPLPTLMHEVGIDQKGALKGLASLSEALFAHYDADSEHVFVPEMAAHQIGEPLSSSDNRVKGVVREWISMRKSPFFMDFHRRYATSFHLPNPEDMNIQIKAPSKPLRSQEQEQEQEQEHEKEKPILPPRGKNSIPPTLEEVRAYCLERRNSVDPEAFMDHNQTVGWRYGKGAGKPIKDWQAAVRTWEKSHNGHTSPPQVKVIPRVTPSTDEVKRTIQEEFGHVKHPLFRDEPVGQEAPF